MQNDTSTKDNTQAQNLQANTQIPHTGIQLLNVIRENVSQSYKTMVTGRTQLYKEMGATLVVYREQYLNASTQEQQAFKDKLIAELKIENVKVQKDSKELSLFVKYVFKVNRQSANKYANRLQKAQDLLIPDDKIADYLAGKMDDDKATPKTKAPKVALSDVEQSRLDRAKANVENRLEEKRNQPMATVAFTNVPVIGDYVVMIGKPVNNNTGAGIMGLVNEPSEALINAIKEALFKAENEELLIKDTAAQHAYTGAPQDFSEALEAASKMPMVQNGDAGQPVTDAQVQPEAALA